MPPPSFIAPPGFSARWAALTSRERLFLAAGAAALVAFLIYLILPGDDPVESEPVELAPVSAAPPPIMPVTPSAPPIQPPAPPIPSASSVGLVLKGVMGGGPAGGAAIIASSDGNQRVVRIGREFMPGMVLKEVGLNHAILSGGGMDTRLDLNRVGGVSVPAAPGSAVSPPAAGAVSQQRETTAFQLGLEPMKRNGRVAGYSFRPGASIPPLEKAGLQPGDVVLGVNGSVLDEERLMELSWQIANSERTEFEFVRNGKRMKAAIGGEK